MRAGLLAFLVALMLGASAAVMAAQVPPSASHAAAFEIDGDKLADDSGDGSLDWDDPLAGQEPDEGVIKAARNPDGTCAQLGTLVFGLPGGKGTGALVCDGSIGGSTELNVFGTGDKESEGANPIEWTIRSGSVPKKADLSEVYVYATVGDSSFDDDPGPERDDDVFLALDLTRLDVNGDTHADFEFNQKPLAVAGAENCPTPAATHCQERTDGDLILAFDLDPGAATPQIRVFQFRESLGAGEVCADGQATPPPGCYVQIATPTSATGDPSVMGVLNGLEIAAPSWGTVGCEPVSGDKKPGCHPRSRIPARGDLEGYVDLSAFLTRDLDLCPGFGQLTAKTRSSSSISSSLADIAGPIELRSTVCGSLLVANVGRLGQPVSGTGIAFSPDPITGEEGTQLLITDGSAEDHAAAAGFVCLDGARFGSFVLSEAVTPSGYFGDPDTEAVSVLSPSTCAQRLGTEGSPIGTVDATFVNLQGAFLIRNEDDHGRLLGGATFTVLPDPHTRVSGSSLDFTDADGDGVVCIQDVYVDQTVSDGGPPTSYDVIESKAPKNYVADDAIRTVPIAVPGTCAEESPAAPDAIFVNVRGKGGKP